MNGVQELIVTHGASQVSLADIAFGAVFGVLMLSMAAMMAGFAYRIWKGDV